MGHLTWRYVAGFYDAEGGIEFRTARSIRLTISQHERNGFILDELEKFFDLYGILSARGVSYSRPAGDQLNIRVASKDAFLMLKKMAPYLIVQSNNTQTAFEAVGLAMPTKKPMSWQYLAGFTDGDGHIGVRFSKGCRQHRVIFAQSGKWDGVIDEIQEFLSQNGISSYRGLSSVGAVSLTVSQYDVNSLLKKLRPYLVVTKEKSASAISYLSARERTNMNYKKRQEAKKGGV